MKHIQCMWLRWIGKNFGRVGRNFCFILLTFKPYACFHLSVNNSVHILHEINVKLIIYLYFGLTTVLTVCKWSSVHLWRLDKHISGILWSSVRASVRPQWGSINWSSLPWRTQRFLSSGNTRSNRTVRSASESREKGKMQQLFPRNIGIHWQASE